MTAQRLPHDTQISGFSGQTLVDFWTWAYSDLISNTTRPILAEWIVGTLLDCLPTTRTEWDGVDLVYQGHGIEVKSGGYVQSWEQKGPSKLIFDIAKKLSWDAATNTYASIKARPAKVYVFAIHHEQDRSLANALDLSQWLFYVVPTVVLDQTFGDQKSVVLSRIQTIAEPVTGADLRVAVNIAIGDANR
jgi:hypothetical protein